MGHWRKVSRYAGYCYLSVMRLVIQRVLQASVAVDDVVIGTIGQGLLLLLGVEGEDNQEDAEWLCKKVAQLRIFSDDKGLMNRDIQEVDGDILVVSQFTLFASYKKGNRPSFVKAARPEHAVPLYEYFVHTLSALTGKPIATGRFGADMKVSLVNDGPVTIVMDTKNKE
jgi:D-aminoacyl-tRNA deacylase